MARPREFDTDTALADAMSVFWDLTYEEAKLPDLLSGMKLTRGSFYKAFKDKKSVFLLVLALYDAQAVSDAVAHLTRAEGDGWDRITALFSSIAQAVEAGDRRGCLLCSTIAGAALLDDDIAAFAQKSLERLRQAFEDALADSSVTVSPKPMSQFLVTQYVGLRVLARTDIGAAIIRDSIPALAELRS